MKATAVTKLAITLGGTRVTLGLAGPSGEIEITVPVGYVETLTASLLHDGELAVMVEPGTAAHAVACLNRMVQMHLR
ncbi:MULTISPECIES: hypothetical protein [unclassified Nocardiopsis]|uniref:hypothetical protein n=1 Tax=unclassified Nocardiopsis TaxID=2649073 RepID=UPI0013573479|nr:MULTISPECIES: hypothetical protein [unclassified Nocardiopsis]